jgi:hypothetical protein
MQVKRSYKGSENPNCKYPMLDRNFFDKIDDSKPSLELPQRIIQIVPKPIVHVELVQVDELSETVRGAGGYGSTGVK